MSWLPHGPVLGIGHIESMWYISLLLLSLLVQMQDSQLNPGCFVVSLAPKAHVVIKPVHTAMCVPCVGDPMQSQLVPNLNSTNPNSTNLKAGGGGK